MFPAVNTSEILSFACQIPIAAEQERYLVLPDVLVVVLCACALAYVILLLCFCPALKGSHVANAAVALFLSGGLGLTMFAARLWA